VANNELNGIFVSGEHTTVSGNIIGLNRVATEVMPNKADGISFRGFNGTIQANTVVGNRGNGIFVNSANVTVRDNFVGLKHFVNATTALDFGNELDGIYVGTLGSFAIVQQNFIAGNGQYGIDVNAPHVQIMSNTVGLDVSAAAPLPNLLDGIFVATGATNVVIRDNTVSGNGGSGITVLASSALIESNEVGLLNDGLSAAPNGQHGIVVMGAGAHVVLNVVAGNANAGVRLVGNRSECVGNIVGLDRTGQVGVGNRGAGVAIEGHDVSCFDNVVSSNGKHGIDISGERAVVFWNMVGADKTGALKLGNGISGIHVTGAQCNISNNVVAFTQGIGILLATRRAPVYLRKNSAFSNLGPGVATTDVVPAVMPVQLFFSGTAAFHVVIDIPEGETQAVVELFGNSLADSFTKNDECRFSLREYKFSELPANISVFYGTLDSFDAPAGVDSVNAIVTFPGVGSSALSVAQLFWTLQVLAACVRAPKMTP
jgi:parallel beta-helix repeat protein